MRIIDWSSDVCSSDLSVLANAPFRPAIGALRNRPAHREVDRRFVYIDPKPGRRSVSLGSRDGQPGFFTTILKALRSEEHTSELQSLMRISYAVFCLKKKKSTHLKINLNIIMTISHTRDQSHK